ncbi:hypothetical protein IGI04_026212 [Brassica rapa subsp. trilocularis]|uniref:Malectin domain-containing protein n=1 Tax=Brassica rapa subsp. trilocularis TaxID=1813537 RepID=A0ABQ7KY18_BRACM|nr:hypothetical protein IGI04_026212 [Brassica rapa subsp. trilocularis]
MYPSPFLPVATTTKSNQFNFWSLWYWLGFQVVATKKKNRDRSLLAVRGLDTFTGDIVHSSQYSAYFKGKNVLTRGGNYGLEISFDLNNLDANTIVMIRTSVF